MNAEKSLNKNRFHTTEIMTKGLVVATAAGIMIGNGIANADKDVYIGGTWDKQSQGNAGLTTEPDARVQQPAEPPIIGAIQMPESIRVGAQNTGREVQALDPTQNVDFNAYSGGRYVLQMALGLGGTVDPQRVASIQIAGDPCGLQGAGRLPLVQDLIGGVRCDSWAGIAPGTPITSIGFEKDTIYNIGHPPGTIQEIVEAVAGYYNVVDGHGGYEHLDINTIDPSRLEIVEVGGVKYITILAEKSATAEFIEEHGYKLSPAELQIVNAWAGFNVQPQQTLVATHDAVAVIPASLPQGEAPSNPDPVAEYFEETVEPAVESFQVQVNNSIDATAETVAAALPPDLGVMVTNAATGFQVATDNAFQGVYNLLGNPPR